MKSSSRDRILGAGGQGMIDAFNHKVPCHQFTIHQIAGDLLPHATVDQTGASGIRETHTNREGGFEKEMFNNETA
jgi:hypothetical protein